MQQPTVKTLVLEFVDTNGASHIRQMHIEILHLKPGTPEHTIRARLIVIIILWLLVLLTVAIFAKLSRLGTWLLVPYLGWATFATALNAAIVYLN